MASVGNVGNGTNEKEAVQQPVEEKTVQQSVEEKATNVEPKGQEVAETAKADVDAENQIAAVLTEMQHASENIAGVAEGEKPAEGSQGSFEPSIAVIMQDESGNAEQPSNGSSGGQVKIFSKGFS